MTKTNDDRARDVVDALWCCSPDVRVESVREALDDAEDRGCKEVSDDIPAMLDRARELTKKNTLAEVCAALVNTQQILGTALDSVRALFDKPAPEPIASANWQPIDTAPKDGTGILLCQATDADGSPIGQDSMSVFMQVAAWWEGEDTWIVYCSMVRDPELHFTPTHWMPLPEVP